MNISKFLNNLKTKPDIWFFLAFLLTFTLNVRKVLFYFPQQRTFNEYTGIYVYISDIFLLLTICLWLIILYYNNTFKLSRDKLWITHFFSKKYLIIPLFLIIWSFISISWSNNQTIAFFRSIKLLEFYLFYLYIVFRFTPFLLIKQEYNNKTKNKEESLEINQLNVLENVPRGTFFDFKHEKIIQYFFLIIISVSTIQSTIAIIQVIIQKSVGLSVLKESFISPSLPGVAKVILGGNKYIRAYGLMPHPNVLGGFLLFSIVVSLLYLKLFHVEQFKKKVFSLDLFKDKIVPRGTILRKKSFLTKWLKIVEICFLDVYISVKKWIKKDERLIKALILIQILALLLTFSKSAIIGLIIALGYIAYKLNVPRGTFLWKWKKVWIMTNLRYFRIIILVILIIFSALVIFLKPDINSMFFQSLRERLLYLNVSRGIISSSPIWGIGAGQFVVSIPHFSRNIVFPWEYQPVHNVFLLIWSELGIIGVTLFSWFLLKLFHVEQFQKKGIFLNSMMFHVEQLRKKVFSLDLFKDKIVPRGTIEEFEKDRDKKGKYLSKKNNEGNILYNKNRYLSINYFLVYSQGILLGFIFIMLFDHYLWDIQQGSLLFWMVCGIIVGNRKQC